MVFELSQLTRLRWDVFIEYLSMQLDKLTIKAQEALQAAQQVAHANSNQEVDADHLMSALLAQTDSLVPALLEKLGVPVGKLAADVDAELERKVKVHGSPSSDLFYSTALKKTLDAAIREAGKLKDEYISTEHLLLGLLDEGSSTLKKLLKQSGVAR